MEERALRRGIPAASPQGGAAPAVHERFARPLAVLSDRDATAATLARIGVRRGLWAETGARWRCRVARIEAGAPPRARLVIESGAPHARMADATLDLSLLAAEHGDLERAAARGGLRLRAFPDDPALPALSAVLAAHPTARVVRYRPGRRCTFHVPASPWGDAFLKVFPSAREGRSVYDAHEAVFAAARCGALPFRVARPLRWDSATLGFWQTTLPGRPVVDVLPGTGGPAIAARLGEATGAVGHAGILRAPVLDARAQLARSTRYAHSLGELVPALTEPAAALLAELEALHGRAPGADLRPIHGSPHAHQWLCDGQMLALVDFDRLSRGDPELDAATFLAEMDYEDPRELPVARIAEAFVAGFERSAGQLDPQRLAAYRAHKHLSKALRAARSVRPDGHRRAARNLARALDHARA